MAKGMPVIDPMLWEKVVMEGERTGLHPQSIVDAAVVQWIARLHTTRKRGTHVAQTVEYAKALHKHSGNSAPAERVITESNELIVARMGMCPVCHEDFTDRKSKKYQAVVQHMRGKHGVHPARI